MSWTPMILDKQGWERVTAILLRAMGETIRFVLSTQGANKGLIVNSRNLCLRPGGNRAQGTLSGQNGRIDRIKPVAGAQGCGGKKRRGHRRAHGHAG
jgi:hypothetical protein